MTDFSGDDFYGIVARLDELIAARPGGPASGFAAGTKVRTQQYGTYRSVFRGRGMEFDEARAYQPGDDIRSIDWRVTARTGRVHTKLFHEERERPVLIVLDARSAMRFGTRDTFKSVLAAKCAAILTWIAIEGGDRVGGLVVAPSGIRMSPPQRSRARTLGFVKAMADATQEGFGREPPNVEPSLTDALARIRRSIRSGTLVFVVSDFHDFDERTARELTRLSLHAPVTNVFIFDGLEAEAPQRGQYRVSDGRAVAALNADSRAVRDAYAVRFATRRAAVETVCRQRGMTFLPIQTGQDPGDLLHPERLQRAGAAARRAAA
ncbi:DUF58 domain-containing protein [Segnochrobactrum spirostomi]|uniref:DUF58 domain-containing protein n=1 Tax=Segnochrobactrum spirostomi TaxID=2608987 RepID=A0A6A7YAF3_9HYPH|nr:DUF58 domain-containing protein [Segnochrobactrum spirostomi]MQT14988.1 DUF58 domain-containing protein [Segnochrobactrum spirostomi]